MPLLLPSCLRWGFDGLPGVHANGRVDCGHCMGRACKWAYISLKVKMCGSFGSPSVLLKWPSKFA